MNYLIMSTAIFLTNKAIGKLTYRSKAFEQEEFMAVLQQCIDRLPPKMAQAFMLRELDALETESICDPMNISLTNFWVMLSRVRLQLRWCLDENWFSH